MQIVVDDLLTHYELQGSGKLIVLLHGWGDNLQGLASLQKTLAQDYQVLAIDLPGFGGTQVPHDTWDLTNYVNFVAATLTKLKLAQPYALIGHSNGGAVSALAVGSGVLQPAKLVLLAASGLRHKGGARRLLLNIIAKTGNLATLWMPARYRTSLRKSLYTAAGSDLLVVPELEETFKKTVRQDIAADAAQVSIPTLLIFGRDDTAVPPSDAEHYHELIVNSELHIIKDAGHFVHLDQPQKTTHLLQEFLA